MIRLSKREDYAIILINELAKNYNKRLVPLSEIASGYSISVLFLRNLAYDMKNEGVIKAVEGKAGGYYLAKDPSKLKMGDVLRIFSKNQLVECCDTPGSGKHARVCPKQDRCITGNVWRKLNKEFIDKIYDLSVKDFMRYNKD